MQVAEQAYDDVAQKNLEELREEVPVRDVELQRREFSTG